MATVQPMRCVRTLPYHALTGAVSPKG